MHVVVMDVAGKTYKTPELHFADFIKDAPKDITYEEFADAVNETVNDTKRFAESPTITMTIDRDETTFNSANLIWVRVFGHQIVLEAARRHFGSK